MAESVKDAQLSLPLRVPLKSGINMHTQCAYQTMEHVGGCGTASSMCSSLPLQLN